VSEERVGGSAAMSTEAVLIGSTVAQPHLGTASWR
jgi:hypothetical protein